MGVAGPHSNELWYVLQALHEAAGKPSPLALARHVPVSKTTLYDWLGRKAIPDEASEPAALRLVRVLEEKAADRGASYSALSRGEWHRLLSEARAEQPRGGRNRTRPGPRRADGPVTLPAPAPAGFGGRDEEVRDLMDWLNPAKDSSPPGPGQAAATAYTVAGMGGVGKTALVLRAAHTAQERGWFTGGILFADVRGYSPDGETDAGALAGRFLTDLGLRPQDVPATAEERCDAWREALHDLARQKRPLLVVLDNVRTGGLVAPLLPPAPHKVVITSRRTLSDRGARTIRLAPLDTSEAMALLHRALTAGGTRDERVTTQPDDARRLAALCGHLPLALMITAHVLRDESGRTLADQADELADTRTRLDALEYEDVDEQGRPLEVRAAFELSYRHLRAEQARAFRLLAAAPGPDLHTAAATALVGRAHTRRLLARLHSAHLVQLSAGDRWSMHDLVRLFADEHGRGCAEEDARDAAVTRLLDHYLTSARAAVTQVAPRTVVDRSGLFRDRGAALDWLDAEHPNLVAAALSPAAGPHPAGAVLPLVLAPYLNHRRHFDDAVAVARSAAETCRGRGDVRGESSALNNLGLALWETRRFEEAITAHRRQRDLAEKTGTAHDRATALNNLGLAFTGAQRYQAAANVLYEAHALFTATGDDHAAARARNNRGTALQQLGRIAEAVTAHTEAARTFAVLDDRQLMGSALANLAAALRSAGRHEDAVALHRQDLAICRELGNRHGEGQGQLGLGLTLLSAGALTGAGKAFAAAAAIFRETGDRRREAEAWGNLGLARSAGPEPDGQALETAAALFRETGDLDDERRALLHRARLGQPADGQKQD
ncbi:tetratricopeptide repeat protein [Streptomyces longwoodensis]|uniref:tetratricopeptide repeat protein n=1 Tax=Streptomyces longwoodensis TaxID=68231 RepID=UPI00386D82D1